MKKNFNAIDRKALENLLAEFSQKSRYTVSLDSLLNDWQIFVHTVSIGYRDSIYDYTNQLSNRDLLEEILVGLSRDGRNVLEGILQPTDNHFILCTLQISRPIISSDIKDLPWWWYRIPRNAIGELKADLLSEGLINEAALEKNLPLDLLPHLKILCTPDEYFSYFTTPKSYVQKYGSHFSRVFGYIPYSNPDYWRVIPIYEYAECPICHTRISDPGDTYSIRAWGGRNDLQNTLFGVQEFPPNIRFPVGNRCSHFLGIAEFTNLFGRVPDEVDSFQQETGEVPFVSSELLPATVESYAVLHALPICRVEDNQFVPCYTVFLLTYFAKDPAAVLQRVKDRQNAEGYKDFRFLAPLGSSTDLSPWVTTGKLGWLDISKSELPLQIGKGRSLPLFYQNIQGQNKEYHWRKPRMVSTLTEKIDH
jgi:hypothetical protein